MAENYERFSRRLGFRRQSSGPLVYHEASEQLRMGTLSMLVHDLNKLPSWVRAAICRVRRIRPDSRNWSEHPNIMDEAQDLVCNAQWHEFYDFVEACAETLAESGEYHKFEHEMNQLFEEEHVGWQLVNGVLEVHGEDSLEQVLSTAEEELEQSGLSVASQEFKEARVDLSRRPEPDLSGAIHHAVAALESVAREVSGDSNRTLGDIIKKYPGLLPPPVDDATAKLWGFASEHGRHGKESRRLEWAETLLIVGIAGALCSYLIAKKDNLR